MIFSWLRRRRRRKLLAAPFPEAWHDYLQPLPFYERLSGEERTRLRDLLRILVREKNWEGCGGLEMTDEIRVTVAAQAALLLLAIDHEYYRHVESILVYPSTFMVPSHEAVDGVGVLSETVATLGLAFQEGPVVLSWDSAHHGIHNTQDGRNLVLHEFAHKLDMLDGFVDGTPPLRNAEHYNAWLQIMTREFSQLNEDAEKGRRTLLDVYGASEPAEFFAVATECFFEKSQALQRRHEELYGLLKTYYGQDPAAREEKYREA